MNHPRNLSWLMAHIERVLPEGGNWCTLEKAQTLASLIVALRPRLIVEIGVWMGGSFVPMLLAANEVAEMTKRATRIVAIDAWSARESAEGQDGKNKEWWSTIDHDKAYEVFQRRVDKACEHGLAVVQVVRSPSDDVDPSHYEGIGLLHIDGNHGEQALRDAQRFAWRVNQGGVVVLDDIAWSGGHVSRAVDYCKSIGFVELYPLDTGLVMQRAAR